MVKLSAFLHGQKAANFTKPLFEALTPIKTMKKSFLFLFLLVVTFFICVVLNSDTKKYAVNEANKICSWLNSDKAEITFRVGPHAFDHLQNFKRIDQEYTCKASSSEHLHGCKDEIAVVVSANRKDKMVLIYGLGVSGRHFYQPRYFQHWTGNKVRHHE